MTSFVKILVSAGFICSLGAAGQTAGAASGETGTVIEIMQTAVKRAQTYQDKYIPIYSPNDQLVNSGKEIKELKGMGVLTVPWTVNSLERMQALFDAGADGIISDRPDLLHELVLKNKNTRGGLLDGNGLLRRELFDAQAHRGGRDLRPESTLPAFENALDNLVTTLETDVAVSKDGVAVLSHEPFVNPVTCRTTNGDPYDSSRSILFKDITVAELHGRFVCDKLIRGDQQKNDVSLSPVSVAFAKQNGVPSVFVHPTVQMLFDFVTFYREYYLSGAGKSHSEAKQRSMNAERVYFNLETKIDPRYPERTVGPEKFVEVLAGIIEKNGMESRADIQSFDFRTLLLTQQKHPKIQTVYLMESSILTQQRLLMPSGK